MDKDLQEMLDKVTAIQSKNDSVREANRKCFPQHALFVDRLEVVFGKVKTLYVQEGGNEAGKRDTEHWIEWRIYAPPRTQRSHSKTNRRKK